MFLRELINVAFAVAPDCVNDLYRYDPTTITWKLLPPSGSAPSPRYAMGFTATPNRIIFVFGGCCNGEKCGCARA